MLDGIVNPYIFTILTIRMVKKEGFRPCFESILLGQIRILMGIAGGNYSGLTLNTKLWSCVHATRQGGSKPHEASGRRNYTSGFWLGWDWKMKNDQDIRSSRLLGSHLPPPERQEQGVSLPQLKTMSCLQKCGWLSWRPLGCSVFQQGRIKVLLLLPPARPSPLHSIACHECSSVQELTFAAANAVCIAEISWLLLFALPSVPQFQLSCCQREHPETVSHLLRAEK